ncbi:MAG: 1-(5-phosphoribosyl)-5-[(5-phosphoribosylamino)methylideneamino] imidazole-4-carboxamide isomerase [Candidatus Thermoplasmatota archaeon]
MEVIPAIDLKNGAAVQLVGGDINKELVRVDDPVEQAREFVRKGSRWIHIVDLDRALGTGSNLQMVKHILEHVPGARFQVGGGIRFTEDIDDLLNSGATRVVIGTRAISDDKWFAHVCERYGDRIIAAVDVKQDEILINGWQASSGKKLIEWAKRADAQGIGGFLYTDVSKEGRLQGANIQGVERLCKQVHKPVIASGGIRDIADLQRLGDSGAWGAVVGMAAYTGRLDLEAAYKTFHGAPR